MTPTQSMSFQPIEHPPAEKRVTLHHVSWNAYQTILEALGEQRSAHLTYYKGTLEIMTPLEAHDNPSDLIGDFVKILVDEFDLTIKSMGSTTLTHPNLKVGAEPDKGFYIANEPLVRGKTVDLATDPPPDLIVEVDITHTDINKNALYAEMEVPEFWRYDGQQLTIYELHDGKYEAVETSPTFPNVSKERLYEFLKECAQQGETQAKRNLREWIKNMQERYYDCNQP
jgi:Uma2 family endonuclease